MDTKNNAAGVPETTDEARAYLVAWHREAFTSAPFFSSYIENTLAGDFAFHLARWLARAAAPAPTQQPEPCAPAILEALSWHGGERDDLTIEQAVDAIRHGYKSVRQRTDRAMLLQIAALLAGAPTSQQGQETSECERSGHAYEVYSADGKQRCSYCEKEWLGAAPASSKPAGEVLADLPPLPQYAWQDESAARIGTTTFYTADQMWAYARAALASQSGAEVPSGLDAGEMTRLRRLMAALGMDGSANASDEQVRGLLFTALGQAAGKIERAEAALKSASAPIQPTKGE